MAPAVVHIDARRPDQPYQADQLAQPNQLEIAEGVQGFGGLMEPFGFTIENLGADGLLDGPPAIYYFSTPPGREYMFSKLRGGQPHGIYVNPETNELPHRDHFHWSSNRVWKAAHYWRQIHPDTVMKAKHCTESYEQLYDYFDGHDLYHIGAYNAWNLINTMADQNAATDVLIEADKKQVMVEIVDEWLQNIEDAEERLLAWDWVKDESAVQVMAGYDDADLGKLTERELFLLNWELSLRFDKLVAAKNAREDIQWGQKLQQQQNEQKQQVAATEKINGVDAAANDGDAVRVQNWIEHIVQASSGHSSPPLETIVEEANLAEPQTELPSQPATAAQNTNRTNGASRQPSPAKKMNGGSPPGHVGADSSQPGSPTPAKGSKEHKMKKSAADSKGMSGEMESYQQNGIHTVPNAMPMPTAAMSNESPVHMTRLQDGTGTGTGLYMTPTKPPRRAVTASASFVPPLPAHMSPLSAPVTQSSFCSNPPFPGQGAQAAPLPYHNPQGRGAGMGHGSPGVSRSPVSGPSLGQYPQRSQLLPGFQPDQAGVQLGQPGQPAQSVQPGQPIQPGITGAYEPSTPRQRPYTMRSNASQPFNKQSSPPRFLECAQAANRGQQQHHNNHSNHNNGAGWVAKTQQNSEHGTTYVYNGKGKQARRDSVVSTAGSATQHSGGKRISPARNGNRHNGHTQQQHHQHQNQNQHHQHQNQHHQPHYIGTNHNNHGNDCTNSQRSIFQPSSVCPCGDCVTKSRSVLIRTNPPDIPLSEAMDYIRAFLAPYGEIEHMEVRSPTYGNKSAPQSEQLLVQFTTDDCPPRVTMGCHMKPCPGIHRHLKIHHPVGSKHFIGIPYGLRHDHQRPFHAPRNVTQQQVPQQQVLQQQAPQQGPQHGSQHGMSTPMSVPIRAAGPGGPGLVPSRDMAIGNGNSNGNGNGSGTSSRYYSAAASPTRTPHIPAQDLANAGPYQRPREYPTPGNQILPPNRDQPRHYGTATQTSPNGAPPAVLPQRPPVGVGGVLGNGMGSAGSTGNQPGAFRVPPPPPPSFNPPVQQHPYAVSHSQPNAAIYTHSHTTVGANCCFPAASIHLRQQQQQQQQHCATVPYPVTNTDPEIFARSWAELRSKKREARPRPSSDKGTETDPGSGPNTTTVGSPSMASNDGIQGCPAPSLVSVVSVADKTSSAATSAAPPSVSALAGDPMSSRESSPATGNFEPQDLGTVVIRKPKPHTPLPLEWLQEASEPAGAVDVAENQPVFGPTFAHASGPGLLPLSADGSTDAALAVPEPTKVTAKQAQGGQEGEQQPQGGKTKNNRNKAKNAESGDPTPAPASAPALAVAPDNGSGTGSDAMADTRNVPAAEVQGTVAAAHDGRTTRSGSVKPKKKNNNNKKKAKKPGIKNRSNTGSPSFFAGEGTPSESTTTANNEQESDSKGTGSVSAFADDSSSRPASVNSNLSSAAGMPRKRRNWTNAKRGNQDRRKQDENKPERSQNPASIAEAGGAGVLREADEAPHGIATQDHAYPPHPRDHEGASTPPGPIMKGAAEEAGPPAAEGSTNTNTSDLDEVISTSPFSSQKDEIDEQLHSRARARGAHHKFVALPAAAAGHHHFLTGPSRPPPSPNASLHQALEPYARALSAAVAVSGTPERGGPAPPSEEHDGHGATAVPVPPSSPPSATAAPAAAVAALPPPDGGRPFTPTPQQQRGKKPTVALADGDAADTGSTTVGRQDGSASRSTPSPTTSARRKGQQQQQRGPDQAVAKAPAGGRKSSWSRPLPEVPTDQPRARKASVALGGGGGDGGGVGGAPRAGEARKGKGKNNKEDAKPAPPQQQQQHNNQHDRKGSSSTNSPPREGGKANGGSDREGSNSAPASPERGKKQQNGKGGGAGGGGAPGGKKLPPVVEYEKGDRVDLSRGETLAKHRWLVWNELNGNGSGSNVGGGAAGGQSSATSTVVYTPTTTASSSSPTSGKKASFSSPPATPPRKKEGGDGDGDGDDGSKNNNSISKEENASKSPSASGLPKAAAEVAPLPPPPPPPPPEAADDWPALGPAKSEGVGTPAVAAAVADSAVEVHARLQERLKAASGAARMAPVPLKGVAGAAGAGAAAVDGKAAPKSVGGWKLVGGGGVGSVGGKDAGKK